MNSAMLTTVKQLRPKQKTTPKAVPGGESKVTSCSNQIRRVKKSIRVRCAARLVFQRTLPILDFGNALGKSLITDFPAGSVSR